MPSPYGTLELFDSCHPDNYNAALNESRRPKAKISNRILLKAITGTMLPEKRPTKRATTAKKTTSTKRK